MSSTVAVDGFQITSNQESAEEMVEALSPRDPEAEYRPRVLVSKGEKVEETDPEKLRVSKAAAELGKAGAAARAAKPEPKEGKDAGTERLAEIDKIRKRTGGKPIATEGEGDEEQDGDEQVDETDGKKPLGNPRHDPRARVAQATREAKEAREAAAAERAKREEVERKLAEAEKARSAPAPKPAEAQPQAPPAPRQDAPGADPQPKVEDFKEWEDYVEARTRWAARDEHRKLQQETLRQQVTQRAAHEYTKRVVDAATAFQGRIKDAGGDDFVASLHPDVAGLKLSEIARAHGEDITAHHVIADEIFTSEHGPALMKHLSDHPDEFQRLATLQTPRDIAREVAKLEDRLSAATAGTSVAPLPVSKAKPPVKPVTGSPHTDVEPGDDDSYESHVAFHNAKDRRKR